MIEKRKNYEDFSDKIVIADSSPLINLHKIDKMYYLRELFVDVYTTETVKDECHFELPKWIKIEEPKDITKSLLIHKHIDPGEQSAIGLAVELMLKEQQKEIKTKSILILDDTNARKAYKKLKIGIESISIKDILSFAYDKKFFDKQEGLDLIKKLEDNKFTIKKDDVNRIFGETENTLNKKVKK